MYLGEKQAKHKIFMPRQAELNQLLDMFSPQGQKFQKWSDRFSTPTIALRQDSWERWSIRHTIYGEETIRCRYCLVGSAATQIDISRQDLPDGDYCPLPVCCSRSLLILLPAESRRGLLPSSRAVVLDPYWFSFGCRIQMGMSPEPIPHLWHFIQIKASGRYYRLSSLMPLSGAALSFDVLCSNYNDCQRAINETAAAWIWFTSNLLN